MKIQEHNVETGEEIIRDMTAEELAAYQANIKANADFEKEKKDKQLRREALLEKLGLTAEEAELILNA